MLKSSHEVRDPIHTFIRFSSAEREVLNSQPFQRLRHIHQLAMSYLVYPGATHRRFEHSLGVMELANRVFGVITDPGVIRPEIREMIPELGDPHLIQYWSLVLRMAALCHDLGHLPFSHAAEKELLPDGWSHERLTSEIILSPDMQEFWESMKLKTQDIIKLALGPEKAKGMRFSAWETILAEIIVGDAFGVDRMDYLLRDSHHTGVAYGRFDHHRLIDTLRILPRPASGYRATNGAVVEDKEITPMLGIQEGGLQSAESLLLARYFMFSQVYYHPVRVIYDIHLLDFLREWLPDGHFTTDICGILKMTDNEVTAAFREAAFNATSAGHDAAKRIVLRGHYKRLYAPTPDDSAMNPRAGEAVKDAAAAMFGAENVRYKNIPPKDAVLDFPVETAEESIVSARALSRTIRDTPQATADYVFIEPSRFDEAKRWKNNHVQAIITPVPEKEEGHESIA